MRTSLVIGLLICSYDRLKVDVILFSFDQQILLA